MVDCLACMRLSRLHPYLVFESGAGSVWVRGERGGYGEERKREREKRGERERQRERQGERERAQIQIQTQTHMAWGQPACRAARKPHREMSAP